MAFETFLFVEVNIFREGDFQGGVFGESKEETYSIPKKTLDMSVK